MYKYIEMNTLASNNCIDIKEIDSFKKFAEENNIKTIFYGKRTDRNIAGECFLFVFDKIYYVFTYKSKYGLYKNIEDFINGTKNGFENANAYYFSKSRNLNNYPDMLKYIFDEYSINIIDLEKPDEMLGEYYADKGIKIIDEIEGIRKKYKFNSKDECIFCYNILHNLKKEKSYTIDELYNICVEKVEFYYDSRFESYAVYLKISDGFEKQFKKNVENDEDEWELDSDAFRVYIEKMIKMLKIQVKIKKELLEDENDI